MTDERNLTGLASDASEDDDEGGSLFEVVEEVDTEALSEEATDALRDALAHVWQDWKINPNYSFAPNGWWVEMDRDGTGTAEVELNSPTVCGVYVHYTLSVFLSLYKGDWHISGTLYAHWVDARGRDTQLHGVEVTYNPVERCWQPF